MIRIVVRLSVLLLVGLSTPSLVAQKNPSAPRPAPATAASAPATPGATLAAGATSGAFDDAALTEHLAAEAERLFKAGKTVPLTNLIAQLTRTRCALRLPAPATDSLGGVELMRRYRNSVVAVGGLFKCTRCPDWHTDIASGFFVSEDGVLATSYHVVKSSTDATLVVMTADQRVQPVLEVLAANKGADVALLRIGGSGFTPIPLAPDAPVGTPVRVISHPDGRFFSLTEGLISRYFFTSPRRRTVMMSITADFAKGSSGGPVLNEAGNAVGMVANTQSVYYDERKGHQENLQMVVKNCTTAKSIRDLITLK